MKADETMSAVVELLIDKIEAGAPTWQMPWCDSTLTLPINFTTRVAYRGGNTVACWMRMLDSQWSSSLWATYKQWGQVGGQVRKG